MKNVTVDQATGCWLWEGALNDGYAHIKRDGKTHLGHKYFYEKKYGPVPKGLVLDHVACNIRRCINPDHVTPVTNVENTRRTGCKISIEDANEIRRRYSAAQASQVQLAEEYGISRSNVCMIVKNQRWQEAL